MISDAEVLGRLALALALCALIGLEREVERVSAVGRSWPSGMPDEPDVSDHARPG